MQAMNLMADRLNLRPLKEDDEKAVFLLLSDEQVIKYMLFPVFTAERARAFVADLQEPPAAGLPRQVIFGMANPDTNELVGLCGLVLRQELEEGEIWYLLRPDLWGRGLVTEAARDLVEHGFRELALHRIWASCLPENPGSARVLEKLGFRREGLHRQNLQIHGVWRDSYHYAILASEWQAKPDSGDQAI